MKEFMKYIGIIMLMVGLAAGVHSATWGENRAMAAEQSQVPPQAVQELVINIEKNGMQAVVLQGDQLKAFSNLSVEMFGYKAAIPADGAYLVTPDPRAFSGAGEHETSESPWPLVVYTADGHKYQAMAPRGAIETILNKVDAGA